MSLSSPSPNAVESDSAASSNIAASTGLRVSTRVLAMTGLLAVLLATAYALFVAPTAQGQAAQVGRRVAEGVTGHEPGIAPPYARVRVELIRDTRGSVWSHDLAESMAGRRGNASNDHSGALVSGVVTDWHGPATVVAFQPGSDAIDDGCRVRVSAQAFDHVGTPYGALLARVGSREDSFLLLIAHELAHCYWNPAPGFEASLNSRTQAAPQEAQHLTSLLPLAVHLAESYADAYSLVFAARFDQNLYERAYQGLVAVRASKQTPGNVYDTLDAVGVATELIPTLPAASSPLSARWDVTHRYVLSAALTGSMRWLIAQGQSQDQAIANLTAVLKGERLTFGLRQVGGKDYLIVSAVPEALGPGQRHGTAGQQP